MRIYVASSWRNDIQPGVVQRLRLAGHEVYDFKNPPDQSGFHWTGIKGDPENWTPTEFIEVLKHPLSEKGFKSDFDAMNWCDCIVMVNPCGSSAHLELGWGAGAGKKTVVFCPSIREPELMIKVADLITDSIDDVITFCDRESEPS